MRSCSTARQPAVSANCPGTNQPEPASLRQLAEAVTASGEVTAFGSVLRDVARESDGASVAAVVIFSDFANNSGASPLLDRSVTDGSGVGAPISTVGLGNPTARDVSVELHVDPRIQLNERSLLSVLVRQSGLAGETVNLSVSARSLAGGDSVEIVDAPFESRTVELSDDTVSITVPFLPVSAGPIEFAASVDPVPGETVVENNRVLNQATVMEDHLRLQYVAFEPSWEWRFVKEVFHRDRLVGMAGFRTYLDSSDPRVRQTNVLFLDSLVQSRQEFFANDVVFLEDMPRAAMTDRFTGMLEEFVAEMAGGLVVLAGPRFGIGELEGTPLEDMLPVAIQGAGGIRGHEFVLRRTAEAKVVSYMQLGDDEEENALGWENLGPLPWYQPVTGVRDEALVLAEHPSDRCEDGVTPQPLIAARRYGKGEVVYIGFNEMWRLRRKYGERFYRRFWSQLIYRLGMSHAVGPGKTVRRAGRPGNLPG